MAELGDEVLWLQFLRPYGHLGLVPWEQLLGGVARRPVLRLSEGLGSFRRAMLSGPVRVALCGSMPRAKEDFRLAGHLSRLADHLARGQVEVEVFTDGARCREVAGLLRDLQAESVEVHRPDPEASYSLPEASLRIRDRPGELVNPWLLWMRDRLVASGVDAFHFVGHGFFSGNSGAIALAESPIRNQDRRMARFVGAAELDEFLTQVGAWCFGSSSPENDFSLMGSRLLAHSIANRRPGVVFHHELRRDADSKALGKAYGLFLSGRPEAPSISPALTVWSHPDALPDHGSAEDATRVRQTRASGGTLESRDPGWLAAADRHLEKRQLALSRAGGEDPDVLPFAESDAPAPTAGRRQVLERMRAIIDDYSGRRR